MAKTFSVPVHFEIEAETQHEAWEKILELMQSLGKPALYCVSEPIEITEEKEN